MDEGPSVGVAPKIHAVKVVEIHGVPGRVRPRARGVERDPEPVDVNGKLGQVLSWDEERGLCLVQTLDELLVPVLAENLRRCRPPDAAEGGFDLLWPCHRDGLDSLAAQAHDLLAARGWCLLQLPAGRVRGWQAAAQASRRKRFESPREEFLADYLGHGGSGKLTEFNPLALTSAAKARRQIATAPPDADGLERCDLELSELYAALAPLTWDILGFNAYGRTEALVWTAFASPREAQALAPRPLLDEDVEAGLLERHIQFLRRRKLGLLYMVESEGGWCSLHPREDLVLKSVHMPIKRCKLLVFRSDLFRLKYQPMGNHVTLLAWVLEDPPQLHIHDLVGDACLKDDALGLLKGPGQPHGKARRVVSLACETGGRAFCAASSHNMYMAGMDGGLYVPSARFDIDIYFSKHGHQDHVPLVNSYHHHASFCDDSVMMSFDNQAFCISEGEASIMPPQQRKALQVGYECLCLAGLTDESMHGAPIAVYLGDIWSEWWHVHVPRLYSGEAVMRSNLDWNAPRTLAISASRISFQLGLMGPHFVADTACSSGLTAYCLGVCQMGAPIGSLGQLTDSTDPWRGGLLAGGVNLIVDCMVYLGNCASHMLSLKGRCFSFDHGGDGYGRGEGTSLCYTVSSDSFKDAEAQEGVCIGSRVNQDGRSASMTAPNGPAQQMCIMAALKEAAIKPHEVTASECHGTGTSLGDPIEVGSLKAVQERDDREVAISCTSSKSNIGHLEANAGVAGLFKCLLMCKYGLASSNVHLRTLNGNLDTEGWPAYFLSEDMGYGANSGIAGVSSFGISGTNAHAEVWGACRVGPDRPAGLNLEKVSRITVLCPVTLGPIDHLTGETMPKQLHDGPCRADVLRDELAQYDVSSYAYEGEYRYRKQQLDMTPVDPGCPVCVCGSWTGWRDVEEMVQDSTGSYHFTMTLGETRCEMFYLCLSANRRCRIYPAINRASSKIWIQGPDSAGEGLNWMIDGRDEEVPMGTAYIIHFRWVEEWMRISWDEVSREFAPARPSQRHTYSIVGSFSTWQFIDLPQDAEEEDVWTYEVSIGPTGTEEFQFVRDHDWQQAIYPAEGQATTTSIPVRGPDDLGQGKNWLVCGAAGDRVSIRLEVFDGKITVEAHSEVRGRKVWKSLQGWSRHQYCISASWNDWNGEPMAMDPEVPGVFRSRGVMGEEYSEEANAYVEFFQVLVDGDKNLAMYPELPYAGSGVCTVQGPDANGEDKPWMLKSFCEGAGFEVVLNLRAVDRRRIVTWTWEQPQKYDWSNWDATR